MKNILNRSFLGLALCSLAAALALTACKKDSDGSPDNKPGNLQSSGITPGEAPGGAAITLKGSGLGGIVSIVFDKNNVPAVFTSTLNTESAIVFRVPDTAFGGNQNIIFTNSEGKKLSVPFKVIALPTITDAAPLDFQAGTVVTIKGNNLDDVSAVVIDGTTTAATIVSKSRKQLVIQMPATTLNRVKLKITNGSGDRVTTQEFTYVPNAFAFFTDTYGPSISDWSWCTSQVSNAFAFMGSNSIKATYSAGGWQALSLHRDDPRINVSDYKYLTFWVKGGTADTQLDINSENGGSTKTVTVPASVWTYFKMDLVGFMSGVQLERLDFKMHGPDGGNQSIYFDNILFVK